MITRAFLVVFLIGYVGAGVLVGLSIEATAEWVVKMLLYTGSSVFVGWFGGQIWAGSGR